MKKLVWFLSLLIVSSLTWAETPPSPSAPPTLTPEELALAKQYGIDPLKTYPGYLTVKALEIQLKAGADEAKVEADAAWSEGFKAAAVKLDPKVAAETARADRAELDLGTWKTATVGTGAALVLAIVVLAADLAFRK